MTQSQVQVLSVQNIYRRICINCGTSATTLSQSATLYCTEWPAPPGCCDLRSIHRVQPAGCANKRKNVLHQLHLPGELVTNVVPLVAV